MYCSQLVFDIILIQIRGICTVSSIKAKTIQNDYIQLVEYLVSLRALLLEQNLCVVLKLDIVSKQKEYSLAGLPYPIKIAKSIESIAKINGFVSA